MSRWLATRVADETDEFAVAYVDANFWALTIFRGRGPSGLVRARLQEFRADCGPDQWEAFFRDNPADPFSVGERLFFTIFPDEEGDREASERYWVDFLADALEFTVAETGDRYRGFAEGCLEYWELWEETESASLCGSAEIAKMAGGRRARP